MKKYIWIGKKGICKSCNRPADYKPISCSEPEHQIYYNKILSYQKKWNAAKDVYVCPAGEDMPYE